MEPFRPDPDAIVEQLHALALFAKRRLLSFSEHTLLKGLVVTQDVRMWDAIHAIKTSPSHGLGPALQNLKSIAAQEAEARFNEVFAAASETASKRASRTERDALGVSGDAAFVYGEIDFASFAKTLRGLRVDPGGTFVDLGSGSGKPVIAAALLGEFGQLIGIEFLSSLHAISLAAHARFAALQRARGEAGRGASSIRFLRGSFLDEAVSWGGADVVFANSTCFDEGLLAAIGEQLEARLRRGALVVTFTRRISHPHLRLVSCEQLPQSWGMATVFVCRWDPDAPLDEAAEAAILEAAVPIEDGGEGQAPEAAPGDDAADAAAEDADWSYDLPEGAFDGWGGDDSRRDAPRPRRSAESAAAAEPQRGDPAMQLDTTLGSTMRGGGGEDSSASPGGAASRPRVGAATGALSTPLKSPLGVRARYTPNSRARGASGPPLVAAPLRSLPELQGSAGGVHPEEPPGAVAQPAPVAGPASPAPAPVDEARERAFVRGGVNLPGAVNCDDDDDAGASGPAGASRGTRSFNIAPAIRSVRPAAAAPAAVDALDSGLPPEGGWLGGAEEGGGPPDLDATQDDSFIVGVEVATAVAGATAALGRIGARAAAAAADPVGPLINLWDLPRGASPLRNARPASVPLGTGPRPALVRAPAALGSPPPRSRSSGAGSRRPAQTAPHAASPAARVPAHVEAPYLRPPPAATPGLTPGALQREYAYAYDGEEEGGDGEAVSPYLRGGGGSRASRPVSHDGRLTRRSGARAPLGQYRDGGDGGAGFGAADAASPAISPTADPARRHGAAGGAFGSPALAPAQQLHAWRQPVIADATGGNLVPQDSVDDDDEADAAASDALLRGLRRQYAAVAAARSSPAAPPASPGLQSLRAVPLTRALSPPTPPRPTSQSTPSTLHAAAEAPPAPPAPLPPPEGPTGCASPQSESAQSTSSAPITLVPSLVVDTAPPVAAPGRLHLPSASPLSRGPPAAAAAAPNPAPPVEAAAADVSLRAASRMSSFAVGRTGASLSDALPASRTAGHSEAPAESHPPLQPARAASGFAVDAPIAGPSVPLKAASDAFVIDPVVTAAPALPPPAPAPAPAPAHTGAPRHALPQQTQSSTLVQPSPRHATSPDGFQPPLSGRQSGGHSSQHSAQPPAVMAFGASGGADGFLLSGALSSPRTYVSGAHGAGFAPTAFRAVPSPRKLTPRVDHGPGVGTPPLAPVAAPGTTSTPPSGNGSTPREALGSGRAPADSTPIAPVAVANAIAVATPGAPPIVSPTAAHAVDTAAVVVPPPTPASLPPHDEHRAGRPTLTISPAGQQPTGAFGTGGAGSARSVGSGHPSARSATSGTPRNVPKLSLARLTPPVVDSAIFFASTSSAAAASIAGQGGAAATAASQGPAVRSDASGASAAADTAVALAATGIAPTGDDSRPATGPSPAVPPPTLQLTGRSYISSTDSSPGPAGEAEGITFGDGASNANDAAPRLGDPALVGASVPADPSEQSSGAPVASLTAADAPAAVSSHSQPSAPASEPHRPQQADAETQTEWSAAQEPPPAVIAVDAEVAPDAPDSAVAPEESSPRPTIRVSAGGRSVSGDFGAGGPLHPALRRARSESRAAEVFSPAIPEDAGRARSDSCLDGTSSPFGNALMKAHRPPPRSEEVYSPAIPDGVARARSDSRLDGTSSPYGNALMKAHRPPNIADSEVSPTLSDVLSRVRSESQIDGTSSPFGNALMKAHRPPPRSEEVFSPAIPEGVTRARGDSRVDGTSSPYGNALLKAHRPPQIPDSEISPGLSEALGRVRSDSRVDGTSSPFGNALLKAHRPPARSEEVFSPAIPEGVTRARGDSRVDGTSSPYGSALLKAHRPPPRSEEVFSPAIPEGVTRARGDSRVDGTSSPYGNALLKAHRPPQAPDSEISPTFSDALSRVRSSSHADGTSSPYGSALMKAHRLPARSEEVFSPAIPDGVARVRSDSRADGTSSPYGSALMKAHRPPNAPDSEVSPTFSDALSRVRSSSHADGTSSPYGSALLKAHRPPPLPEVLSPPAAGALARVRSDSRADGTSSPYGSALMKAHRLPPQEECVDAGMSPLRLGAVAPDGVPAGAPPMPGMRLDEPQSQSEVPAAPASVAAACPSTGSPRHLINGAAEGPGADCDVAVEAAAAAAAGPATDVPRFRVVSVGEASESGWQGTPPSDQGGHESAPHQSVSCTPPPVLGQSIPPPPLAQSTLAGSPPLPPFAAEAAPETVTAAAAAPVAASPSGASAFAPDRLSDGAAAAVLLATAPSPAAASEAAWAAAGCEHDDAVAAAAALGSGSVSVASHFSVGSIGAPASLPAAAADYNMMLQSGPAPASALGGASDFGADTSGHASGSGGSGSASTSEGAPSSSGGPPSSSISAAPATAVQTPATIASPPPMPSGVAVRLDSEGAEEVPASMASPALRAVVRELHDAERSWQQAQAPPPPPPLPPPPPRPASSATGSGGGGSAPQGDPVAASAVAVDAPVPPIPEDQGVVPALDPCGSPQGNVLLALKMRREAKGAEARTVVAEASPRSSFSADGYAGESVTPAASAAAPAAVGAPVPPAPVVVPSPPVLQSPPLPRGTPPGPAAAAAAAAVAGAAAVATPAPTPAPAAESAAPLASPPSGASSSASLATAAVPSLSVSTTAPPFSSSLGQLGGIAAAFPGGSARNSARRSITRSHPPSPLSRMPIAAPPSRSQQHTLRPPSGPVAGGPATARSAVAAGVNRRVGLMRSDSMGSEIQDAFLPLSDAPQSVGGGSDEDAEDHADDDFDDGDGDGEDGGSDALGTSIGEGGGGAGGAAGGGGPSSVDSGGFDDAPPQTRWSKYQAAAAAAWPPYRTQLPSASTSASYVATPAAREQRNHSHASVPAAAAPLELPPAPLSRAHLSSSSSAGDIASVADALLLQGGGGGSDLSITSPLTPALTTGGDAGDAGGAAPPSDRSSGSWQGYGEAGLSAAAFAASSAPPAPSDTVPGPDLLSPQASSSITGGGGSVLSSTPRHARSGSGAVGFGFSGRAPGSSGSPRRRLAPPFEASPPPAPGSGRSGGGGSAGGLEESSELLIADMSAGLRAAAAAAAAGLPQLDEEGAGSDEV